VVDQVTQVQQNLRAISELMDRELRVTGFMAPEGAIVCGVDQSTGPDILVVTDADAINPTNQTQADLGIPIQAGYTGNGVELLTLNGDGTVDGVPFYDNTGNGVADSDFFDSPGLGQAGGVLVVDRNNADRGVDCGRIVPGSVNPGAPTSQITVDFSFGVGGGFGSQALAGPVPPNADVVAVPGHVYQVNAANQLLRDGMVLADDVEDLQVAYFFDLNGNGTVDGLLGPPGQQPLQSNVEYPGSVLGGTPYVSNAWDHSLLREVRLDFVVRTRSQDADVLANPGTAQNNFVVRENRVPPAQPPDGFRRRVQTITVRPRNVGNRPPT